MTPDFTKTDCVAGSFPNLLVVDDNANARAGLRDALSSCFRVELASNRADAAAMLRRLSIEIAVIDLRLPGGEGRVLAQEIASGAYGRSIPLITVSTLDALSMRCEMLRAGADFVQKPYDARFILERARALLGLPTKSERRKPCRVLVVDDSSTYGQALAAELRKDGHDIVLAVDGAECLEYVSLQMPDRVLVDVFLPDTDGIELAQRIRAMPRGSELPLLMLTGRENTTVRKRANQAGVTHFMTKETSLVEIRGWVAQPFKTNGQASSAAQSSNGHAPKDLFDRVVVASGLSKVLGRSTLELAVRRAGAEPTALTSQSLARSLEQIERVLTTFLPPAEVRTRMTSITELAEEHSNHVPSAK